MEERGRKESGKTCSWKASEWREKKRETKGDIYSEREREKEKFRVELSGERLKDGAKEEEMRRCFILCLA